MPNEDAELKQEVWMRAYEANAPAQIRLDDIGEVIPTPEPIYAADRCLEAFQARFMTSGKVTRFNATISCNS